MSQKKKKLLNKISKKLGKNNKDMKRVYENMNQSDRNKFSRYLITIK